MTEAEIQVIVDAIAAKGKAEADAKYAKVKSFVLHNSTGLAVGAAAMFVVLKFVL